LLLKGEKDNFIISARKRKKKEGTGERCAGFCYALRSMKGKGRECFCMPLLEKKCLKERKENGSEVPCISLREKKKKGERLVPHFSAGTFSMNKIQREIEKGGGERGHLYREPGGGESAFF